MIIIGLTGGMAMGKSTLSRLFKSRHIPVFDADATVHRLQSRHGRAIAALRQAFPTAIGPNGLDRAALRHLVFSDRSQLTRLEAIMHPLVRAEERAFIARARRAGARLCVLDLPLLLETGGDRRVDLIITASAPASVQLQRIRAHRKLREDDIKAILARQLPDRQRRRLSDIVVPTGLSRYHAQAFLKRHLVPLLAEDRSCVPSYSIRKRPVSIR